MQITHDYTSYSQTLRHVFSHIDIAWVLPTIAAIITCILTFLMLYQMSKIKNKKIKITLSILTGFIVFIFLTIVAIGEDPNYGDKTNIHGSAKITDVKVSKTYNMKKIYFKSNHNIYYVYDKQYKDIKPGDTIIINENNITIADNGLIKSVDHHLNVKYNYQ